MFARKRILALLLVVTILAFLGGAKPARAEADYAERTVRVLRNDEDGGETVALRFYSALPSVPYMGLKAFYEVLLQGEMACEAQPDGSFRFTRAGGGSAVAEPDAGALRSEDLSRFLCPPGQGIFGGEDALMETGFLQVRETVCDGPASPASLDLRKYGIELHAGAEDVYFPLATLSDLFSSYYLIYVTWNGEDVYVVDGSESFMLEDEGVGDYYAPIFASPTRADDMADFAYRELCFNIDTFYGFPGAGPHEAEILELGLDGALEALDPDTREMLRSPLVARYLVGLYRLFNHFLDDNGHTGFTDFDRLLEGDTLTASTFALSLLLNEQPFTEDHQQRTRAAEAASAAQVMARGVPDGEADADSAFVEKSAVTLFGFPIERPRRAYVEQGDTAVFSPQAFAVDYEGWRAFYDGAGPMPLENDTLARTLEALERAASNENIRNFVLDLSVNYGGDTNASLPILALLTGDSRTITLDRLTGQRVTQTFDFDFNFDGAFDARDDVRYPFHFAVVVAGGSFSAANELAVRLHERGVPVLGETSGGGSCAVQVCGTADGLHYQMSSPLALLREDGSSVESGVTPDIPLVGENADGTRDYSALYDLEVLSRHIDAWYQDVPGIGATIPAADAAPAPGMLTDDILEALGEGPWREACAALQAGGSVGMGSKGDLARAVQETLAAFGQDIAADGSFGKKSLAALNAVQAAFGLPQTETLDAEGFAELLPRLLILRDEKAAQALLSPVYSDLGNSEYRYMLGSALSLQGKYYSAKQAFARSRWGDWEARAEACVQPWPKNGQLWKNSDVRGSGTRLTIRSKADADTALLCRIYREDGMPVASLFIGGSGKASVSLPPGTYVIKDGVGKTWYGAEEAFGNEGFYETMLFDDGSSTVKLKNRYAYTITVGVGPDAATDIGSKAETWEDF